MPLPSSLNILHPSWKRSLVWSNPPPSSRPPTHTHSPPLSPPVLSTTQLLYFPLPSFSKQPSGWRMVKVRWLHFQPPSGFWPAPCSPRVTLLNTAVSGRLHSFSIYFEKKGFAFPSVLHWETSLWAWKCDTQETKAANLCKTHFLFSNWLQFFSSWPPVGTPFQPVFLWTALLALL